MPHKKFQHFIKWFDIFIRAKTNMQKKKGKIKQKIKGKAYLVPRAKPAHRGSGVFFPLPRTQAARWNATEPAGGDTSPPSAFQAAPCSLLASWRRLAAAPVHSPRPRRLPLPLSPDSSPPEKHAGAPSSPRVAIDAEKPPESVHRLRRSRLRLRAEDEELKPPGTAESHRRLRLRPPHDFIDSVAVEPPQPSPPPLLNSW